MDLVAAARAPSGGAPVARAAPGSVRTWPGPAATGGCPPSPLRSPAPSVRPPRRPRPCACAGTPRASSRCRCGGRASSAPPAALASPVPLSAVVALRWGQGSVSLASFPPAVSWPGAPFPRRGPSGRFPRVVGTMRRPESPPPVPPRFVAFARSVSRSHPCFVPAAAGCGASAGLELVTRYLPPGFAEKAAGPPRFLGNPRERALFSDPGGTACARPLRRRGAAFHHVNDVGSRTVIHFGAQSHGPLPRRVALIAMSGCHWRLARQCPARSAQPHGAESQDRPTLPRAGRLP
jgi:hypothetical protein